VSDLTSADVSRRTKKQKGHFGHRLERKHRLQNPHGKQRPAQRDTCFQVAPIFLGPPVREPELQPQNQNFCIFESARDASSSSTENKSLRTEVLQWYQGLSNLDQIWFHYLPLKTVHQQKALLILPPAGCSMTYLKVHKSRGRTSHSQ
jgi:hypothetical protein